MRSRLSGLLADKDASLVASQRQLTAAADRYQQLQQVRVQPEATRLVTCLAELFGRAEKHVYGTLGLMSN